MVPFIDLKRRYALYKQEIDDVIGRVLKSGWFILGKELEMFEAKFAEYVGARYTVGLNSGTDAIFLALKALGIEHGDEIITVANTATPTVSAIRMAGAVPVFVDIDKEDFTINPELIEKKITLKTRVILPVHLYGYPANMERITEIAQKEKLKVLEDAAQAQGAAYKNKMVGTMGDIGCFSFYPTKNLGAFGDAGAIATNSKEAADAVRQLRNYGEVSKYNNEREGVNSRLDEIQAAILHWGLDKLDAWNEKRKVLAMLYLSELEGLPLILPPHSDKDHDVVWHLFVVRSERRDALKDYLKNRGIETAIHYPKPIFEQTAYKFLCESGNGLPVTTKVMADILSLPLYPEMRQEEVLEVCAAIKSFYSRK